MRGERKTPRTNPNAERLAFAIHIRFPFTDTGTPTDDARLDIGASMGIKKHDYPWTAVAAILITGRKMKARYQRSRGQAKGRFRPAAQP